jgi:geranylgeranyl diphosphate synthase type II
MIIFTAKPGSESMRTVAELQQLYEAYLVENRFLQMPRELYEPVNYILELGGKRLRPVLTLMGYELFRSDVEKALPVAHAVEIFHNFSLVHDDIMDKAPLRRGQPTLHSRYDVSTAILSGDVMLIYVYEFLLRMEDKSRLSDLVSVFNRVAIEVCEGQQFDMNFEQRTDVLIEEYIDMIGKKTAALISGSLELGAIAAGAPRRDVQRLAAFGRHIGIAFQLQDDILDTFGDPKKFGKKIGGDIIQNKKTFLILKALEVADPETRGTLMRYMTTPSSEEARKVREVTAILHRLNIPELAEAEKRRHQQLAFDHFFAVRVPGANRRPLLQLTEKLIGRET